jgi:hypothetical protein
MKLANNIGFTMAVTYSDFARVVYELEAKNEQNIPSSK